MPGTGDAAIDDAAFADRTILMGAEIGERADRGAVAKHGDALATRRGHDARALVGDGRRRTDRDPAIGRHQAGAVLFAPRRQEVQHRNEAKAAEQHRWNEWGVHILYDP